MAKILIIYSTTDGHTRHLCGRLGQMIEQTGHQVTVISIDDEPSVQKDSFDKIVLGASIRYGKHSKQVYQFIKTYQALLDSKPSAFFSVCLVARKPGKNTPQTNPYFKKFVKRIAWRPKETAVFAGKINYPIYDFWDRQIIRLIMWITKGPTDPRTVAEFTDWTQVEAFARRVSEM
jgi:menaquinone-dependent protoporphyrinogen oxidase